MTTLNIAMPKEADSLHELGYVSLVELPQSDARTIRSGRSGEGGVSFFVGLDDLYYADKFERAFISVNRLRDRKSDFAVNNWIMDSGAFTEISTHGKWTRGVDEYARQINRWRHCGNLLAAVTQDYMCEPFIVAKTGLSVHEHQRRTVARYVALRPLTRCYVMPVLQGFKPGEYLAHLGMYDGLLSLGAWVGVGSVCKRNSHPAVIEHILRKIKDVRPDLRLHGFGLKLTALHRPEIRRLLHSADSMAWSLNARKNGRDAHDWREADSYRERIDAPKPIVLFGGWAAAAGSGCASPVGKKHNLD